MMLTRLDGKPGIMRWITRIAAATLCASLQACVTAPAARLRPASTPVAEARAPVTILVSIDGFRADYLNRGITPNLTALAATGVKAAMRPSYPTITFPNHTTLVTGKRPDTNGIVGNRMEDPGHPGDIFTMQSSQTAWWAQSEPIWITAEKQGVRAATMFWPGSDVPHDGVRPEDWQHFDGNVSSAQRVDAVIDWLRRPATTRPRLVTLYFDIVDHAGHEFGPDTRETNAAIKEADDQIGRLRAGLAALDQPANLVIVADHGMIGIPPGHIIVMDRIVDPALYRFVEGGAYAAIAPQPGHEAALATALLKPHPHLTCTHKADLPARLHYGHNPRVPEYICIAEPGWLVVPTKPDPAKHPLGGTHGYDNAVPEMLALFIAAGPGVRAAGTLPTFDNVDVYPLVARLAGVRPLPSDGDAAPFRDVIVPR